MSPLWLFVIWCPFRLNHCICIMRNEGILHHKQSRMYKKIKVFVLHYAVFRFEPLFNYQVFQYYSTTMTKGIAVLVIYLRIIFYYLFVSGFLWWKIDRRRQSWFFTTGIGNIGENIFTSENHLFSRFSFLSKRFAGTFMYLILHAICKK